MAAVEAGIVVVFNEETVEKKGSWLFREPGHADDLVIGSLYVKKPALAKLGWAEGKALKVTIEVVDA